MSHEQAIEPNCIARNSAVRLLIEAKAKDLGGFSVRRVLPAALQASVGPFVFFDEMGPARFPSGEGINVRPHPHIGLATVTFLFAGEILHRDSLGYEQLIRPGAVNLMTAGRGIVHSERTPADKLSVGQHLHGIQVWMALPDHLQEVAPDFVHHPRTKLPVVEEDGVATTIIIGSYAGRTSPVEVLAHTLYVEQRLQAGAQCRFPFDDQERAIYVVDGEVSNGDCVVTKGTMAVLDNGHDVTLTAPDGAHVMVVGGAPITSRHMFWNFVHTDAARIEQAKAAWVNGEFAMVPGDDEFIPLPQ